ncbi:hypothetical protein KC640_03110, partial [Candidatus Dojkabacteria bacterium]|nr:hypothetical protein [Candidatus Dojkabacteria bacterium]
SIDGVKAMIAEYEMYKKKNADVEAMLDSEPLLKLAVQAANIFGGVTGPALRWITMGGYETSSFVYHKGVVKIGDALMKGMYSLEMLRYWDVFVRKGNPAVEILIDAERTINLQELFESRNKLTLKGQEIRAAIQRGDMSAFDVWFGGMWLAGTGKKETPKAGQDASFYFWKKKIFNLFMDIAKPVANAEKLNDTDKGLRSDKGVKKLFANNPGAALITVDLSPKDAADKMPIDLDFRSLPARAAELQSKGYDPGPPPTFREHMQVVFEEWFEEILARTSIDIPVTSSSPGAEAFAEAYRQAFIRFQELIDPPPGVWAELEKPFVPKQDGLLVPGKDRKYSIRDVLSFSRKDDRDKISEIFIPIQLSSNARTISRPGEPLNTVKLDFSDVKGHEAEIAARLGLKDGAYTFALYSADVFAEWYDKQWQQSNGGVPRPGTLNYKEYMEGFQWGYRLWKQIIIDNAPNANLAFEGEKKIMGANGSPVKKFDLVAMRMLNPTIQGLFKQLYEIGKPDAEPKAHAVLLGIADARGNFNNRWKGEAAVQNNWAIVYPAFAAKMGDVKKVRDELTRHTEIQAADRDAAEKILKSVESKYVEASRRIVGDGLREQYFAESPGIDDADRAELASSLEILLKDDRAIGIDERVAAFSVIVAKGQIPDSVKPTFGMVLGARDVVEKWQANESGEIDSQVDYVRNVFIERSPEAVSIKARIAGAAKVQEGIDSLGNISENLDLNNLGLVISFCYEANNQIKEGLNAIEALAMPKNPKLDEFEAEVDKLLARAAVLDEWAPNRLTKAKVTALQDQYAQLRAVVDPHYVDNQKASDELRDNRHAIQLKIHDEFFARVQRPMVRLIGIPIVTADEWAMRTEFRSAQFCDGAIDAIGLGKIDPGLVSAIEAFVQTNLNEPRLQAIGRNMRNIEPALVASLYIKGALGGGGILTIEDKFKILAAVISVLEP